MLEEVWSVRGISKVKFLVMLGSGDLRGRLWVWMILGFGGYLDQRLRDVGGPGTHALMCCLAQTSLVSLLKSNK